MTVTAETLKGFPLLAGLPEDALEAIASMARQEDVPEGTLVFSEGSPAEHFYLVLNGKVSLEKRVQLGKTGTARRATIEVVGPGQPMGWSSLVEPYEYTSSGVCLEATSLLRISGEDLRRLMAQRPEVGYALIARVAGLIRKRMTSATATLTYFLSIVSHELKRPLAAVENYLQIALEGYAGEVNEKLRRLLERGSLRLSDVRSLISDLLDFARLQPDQIRADFEWVNPSEIGSEAVEEVRLAAAQKDIRIKAVGPTQFQPIVAARRRLRQVLSNLLANAIKFSPEGSTVILAARDESEQLVVEVLDEGIGIPPEDQPHIFEDFYRAANAAEINGAGLGLSIAKKIVDAHEGRIWLESPYQPGKTGTKFTVIIPRGLPLPSARVATGDGKEAHPASAPEREQA